MDSSDNHAHSLGKHIQSLCRLELAIDFVKRKMWVSPPSSMEGFITKKLNVESCKSLFNFSLEARFIQSYVVIQYFCVKCSLFKIQLDNLDFQMHSDICYIIFTLEFDLSSFHLYESVRISVQSKYTQLQIMMRICYYS